MTQQGQSPDVKRMAGFLGEVVAQVRLVWRLLNDPDVPIWLKLIPPLAILYLISPVDILPDPILGLGQLDDAAVILLGLKLFVEMLFDVIAMSWRGAHHLCLKRRWWMPTIESSMMSDAKRA
jgi:uncharacterized membrane protein YkvA (DUF1232 family)